MTTTRYYKARHFYRCDDCGHTIAAGDRYFRMTIPPWEGGDVILEDDDGPPYRQHVAGFEGADHWTTRRTHTPDGACVEWDAE